jgi:hypothetical protein
LPISGFGGGVWATLYLSPFGRRRMHARSPLQFRHASYHTLDEMGIS